jgi:hypothetical protein
LGLLLGAVAIVGFAALFEHFASIKDSAWLRNIFPFGLATDPTWLGVISVCALAASVLLLRNANTS